jgi:O-antigen/teichoic acid export membrane protein
VLVAGRLFGAALFGAFAIAVAVIELAVTLGGAGMKRLLFKLLDEEKGGRTPPHLVIDGIILVAAASLVPIAALMLAVTLLPSGWIAANTATALLLLAPMILGQALIDLLLAATRWTHRMRHQVWGRSVVEPYVGVAAAGLAWAMGYRETGLVIGYWAGTLAALAYALAGARACLGPFEFSAYRFAPARFVLMVRATAWPTLGDIAAALFLRLDLYLVGLLLGEAPAGIYGMAQQVRTPIRQVRQSFEGLLAPIVSRTLKHGGAVQTGQAAASATRLILAIQLPLLIALVVAGEPLLQLIGPEFAAGYWAMLLLAAAETIQGAFGVGDLILLYRRPRAILWVTGAGGAVNLLAGWLLIGAYGLNGAALAALLAALGAAAVRRAFLRGTFGIEVPFHHSAAPFSAAAVALGLALAILAQPLDEGPKLALALALALAAYAIVLRLALAATRETLMLTHFVVEPAPGPHS